LDAALKNDKIFVKEGKVSKNIRILSAITGPKAKGKIIFCNMP